MTVDDYNALRAERPELRLPSLMYCASMQRCDKRIFNFIGAGPDRQVVLLDLYEWMPEEFAAFRSACLLTASIPEMPFMEMCIEESHFCGVNNGRGEVNYRPGKVSSLSSASS